jgi:hypothetical protein
LSVSRNSSGQWFRTGAGGTYPINDGDPQNDVEGFDAEEADEAEGDARVESVELSETLRCERG